MHTDFTFLHVTDYHLGTPRSYRFSPAINDRWAAIKRQMAGTEADLLLVGGDITRDGNTHEEEYLLAKEDLETLPFPAFVVPGNQDVGNKHTDRDSPLADRNDPSLNVTSRRLRLFSSYFGPINWTFPYRGVRFTGFYAAVAGSGLPEERRLRRFLDRLPQQPEARAHVAVMHYWLYIDDIDEPDWDITRREEYLPWYFGIDREVRRWILKRLGEAKVDLLFCGHVHTGVPIEEVNGIRICRSPSAGNLPQMVDRFEHPETRYGFHRCRVSRGNIDVEFVPGADQREDYDSYGPGAHPPVSIRDYSRARAEPPLTPDSDAVG